MVDIINLLQGGAALLAVAVSFITAWFTHRRAKQAQKDQTQIDRARLIHEAYQGVLDELREELNRLSKARQRDREEFQRKEKELEKRCNDLQEQVDEANKCRIKLQREVDKLRRQLQEAGFNYGS